MTRQRIFALNSPYALRVDPSLAAEIGLNESIVLLQLEFLISISDNFRDGDFWMYHSLEELKSNYFPWWHISTISRTIKSLLEKNLIKVGNYNRAGYDRTQWYALNLEGCGQLASIRVETARSILHPAKSDSQDAKLILQDAKSTLQPASSNTRDSTETPQRRGKIIPREGIGYDPAVAAAMIEHAQRLFAGEDE